MRTAECRDFSVATYSVVSFTGTARASCTFTGMPADELAVGFCVAPPEQASVAPIAPPRPASNRLLPTGFRKLIAMDCEILNCGVRAALNTLTRSSADVKITQFVGRRVESNVSSRLTGYPPGS